jgi:hypothetical protein
LNGRVAGVRSISEKFTADFGVFDLPMLESACALDWARITELNAKGISMGVGHSGALSMMGHFGTFQIQEGWRRT